MLKYQSIDRFDIVVATETDNDGTTKEIVERVIGMPGDTIQYENDTLYINGKKTDEPYLTDYIKNSKKTSSNPLILGMIMMTMVCFQRKLAVQAQAFALKLKAALSSPLSFWMMNTYFWVTTGLFPRIVAKSKFHTQLQKEQIQGEAKFHFWPLLPLRPIKHAELSWTSAEFVLERTYKLWNFTFRGDQAVILKISNFFRILLLDEDTDAEDFEDFEIIVTGSMADVMEGEIYTFWGGLVQAPNMANGWKFPAMTKAKPSSKGLANTSPVTISRNRSDTTQKIVQLYGEKMLRTPLSKILAEPEKLTQINGLAAKNHRAFVAKLELNYGTWDGTSQTGGLRHSQ